MEVQFVQVRDDGTVDARMHGDWPIFNEALADAISSLPPRGSTERSLSTYWIDATLDRVRANRHSIEPVQVATGNAYSIVVSDDEAVAVFDYGDDESPEAMPLEDFERLLEDWRVQVANVQGHETREVPETYRRNPWP